MRVKTSVSLPEEMLEALDKLRGPHTSRSELVEAALRAFITQSVRAEQDARDLETINRRADSLNEEALDVLDYQIAW